MADPHSFAPSYLRHSSLSPLYRRPSAPCACNLIFRSGVLLAFDVQGAFACTIADGRLFIMADGYLIARYGIRAKGLRARRVETTWRHLFHRYDSRLDCAPHPGNAPPPKFRSAEAALLQAVLRTAKNRYFC